MTTQKKLIGIPTAEQIPTAQVSDWMTVATSGGWVACTSIHENEPGTRFGLDSTRVYPEEQVENVFPRLRFKKPGAPPVRRWLNSDESSPRYAKASAQARAAAACQRALIEWLTIQKREAEATTAAGEYPIAASPVYALLFGEKICEGRAEIRLKQYEDREVLQETAEGRLTQDTKLTLSTCWYTTEKLNWRTLEIRVGITHKQAAHRGTTLNFTWKERGDKLDKKIQAIPGGWSVTGSPEEAAEMVLALSTQLGWANTVAYALRYFADPEALRAALFKNAAQADAAAGEAREGATEGAE